MKRFSNLCHLVLGVALGSSAIGGWLALTGSFNGGLPVVFGLAVACWVAGFDIIYACQDEAFDRDAGLFSLPASMGAAGALRISRLLHAMTVVLLIGFGVWYHFSWYPIGFGYWVAVALTAGMLVYEHRLVSADDLSKVNEAFFLINGRISITLFIAVLVDKLIQSFGNG
jgi:4-hydroxybenzoate polyprenyltransferase